MNGHAYLVCVCVCVCVCVDNSNPYADIVKPIQNL